jgi:hypothetical protein
MTEKLIKQNIGKLCMLIEDPTEGFPLEIGIILGVKNHCVMVEVPKECVGDDGLREVNRSQVELISILYDDQRHIVCQPFSLDNLHKVAEYLEIKKHWFHAKPYPHYDAPKKWKPPVVCELVSPRRILEICKNVA